MWIPIPVNFTFSWEDEEESPAVQQELCSVEPGSGNDLPAARAGRLQPRAVNPNPDIDGHVTTASSDGFLTAPWSPPAFQPDTEVLCTFWLRNMLRATTARTFPTCQLQKCSKAGVFCTFWLGNLLRATTACTFSTSQLRKVVRHGVLCTFSLGNVLRATTACTFSTSQLPKVSGREELLAFSLANVLRATTACNFSPLISPDGSAPASLASLLFDSPQPMNRDFSTFSRTCIFFLLTLSLLWSSLFCSSPLWLFPPPSINI